MTSVLRHGAPQFPPISGTVPPSDQAAMETALQEVRASKEAWVAIPVGERMRILDQLIRDFAALAPRWVAACLTAKGLAPTALAAAEEWSNGPYCVLRNLRLLRQSLADIQASGKPRIPGPVRTRPDGQVTAQVFPENIADRILFGGVRAEVWMEPGVSAADLPATQALIYAEKQHPGQVALVLGAGNVSSIGPTDILYKLFVEDAVVLFKTNPVNAYLGPLLLEGFRALVERGALRVVYGGAAEGAYLCQQASVDEIHVTGSDKTFDAIVFGTGPEGAQRKAENRPVLNKRVTGELGNVSPVIVVPGPWSASDLAYQAEHIATMLVNNAGFNCNATRVILQHASWDRREALLARIRAVLARVPLRAAYYPGARDRQQAFMEAHAEAEQFGTPDGDELPWTLIPGVGAENSDDIAFTTEAFCGLFAETPIAAATVPAFIERAVAFCNDAVWGSLNATLLVHPASLRDPAIKAAVERAVADLRYGTVAVNYWAAINFALGTTTWGAFPGHALNDIQSGTGVVHNTLMFARPQKSVLRAPFRSIPTPPWFVLHGRAGRVVFARLVRMEAEPSLLKVPAIALAALRT
ncbi:MAG: aldehyde dehydrogenase [Ktedonobacterales bacterium]|nr:aldehyde dehydrogenase [Ktedonobacterales bacterium]